MGMEAVGHVIANRVRNGGGSPTSVVLAPYQFEPWQTRSRELLNYSPEAPIYHRAAAAFDRASSGSFDDPTNGATHFLQEDIVRRRRGGTLPPWATGPQTKIGAHTFYGGKNMANADDVDADAVFKKMRDRAAKPAEANR